MKVKIQLSSGVWLGPFGPTRDPDFAWKFNGLKEAQKQLEKERKVEPYPNARFSADRSRYV